MIDYVIGDVHGKFKKYERILKKLPSGAKSLQLGDMGYGFHRNEKVPIVGENFFFRGNHDHPALCKNHPRYAKEYGMFDDVFVVAGANSIDKYSRKPGVDWWPDEEMFKEDMDLCLEDYKSSKPEIVISHEAPFYIHDLLATAAITRDPNNNWGQPKGNETAFLLDRMLCAHVPRLWIFGHWHISLRFEMKRTFKSPITFVCLDELEVLDLKKLRESLKGISGESDEE